MDRRPSRETSLVVVTTQHKASQRNTTQLAWTHQRQRRPRSVRFDQTAQNEHSVENTKSSDQPTSSEKSVAGSRIPLPDCVDTHAQIQTFAANDKLGHVLPSVTVIGNNCFLTIFDYKKTMCCHGDKNVCLQTRTIPPRDL